MQTQLLRIRDAARALAVSERSVWRMLDRGELTRIRVGAAVRVEHAELAAFISRQRNESADVA
jgi:excisionase family DNA binding protein